MTAFKNEFASRRSTYRLLAAAAVVLGMIGPGIVGQSVSAEAEPVYYGVVVQESKLLSPPPEDPFASDVFVPLPGSTRDRLEFDGTHATIMERSSGFYVGDFHGDKSPWSTFLDLQLKQMDFSIDADGKVVDAVVDGFYVVEYDNSDDETTTRIIRPVTSVEGSFVDGEFHLSIGSSFEAGGPVTTVAELVLEVMPPSGGGGGGGTPTTPPELQSLPLSL
ncbi:MAG: hypothetical protein AAGF73_10585 [Actinomycetota bacterium]